MIPSTQVIDEMFPVVLIFHQINKEGNLEFLYHHYATFNELLDLDTGNQ